MPKICHFNSKKHYFSNGLIFFSFSSDVIFLLSKSLKQLMKLRLVKHVYMCTKTCLAHILLPEEDIVMFLVGHKVIFYLILYCKILRS